MQKVFQWPVRVYWEDTDAGGIVFYANYLKFFERARTEWLRSMGVNQSTLQQQTGGLFVVIETNMRYRQSARLDDELLVTACLQKKGAASLIIEQQALRKTQQGSTELLCEGSIRIGWVQSGPLGLQAARIPDNILGLLT
jgi:acyl-CoA thioester hydrolase